MRFVSTRGDGNKSWSFTEAVFAGFAEDGGMFMPELIPEISRQQLLAWSEAYVKEANYCLYHEIAVDVLSLYLNEEIPREDLQSIINKAITFPVRITHLTRNSTGEPIIHRSDDPTFASKTVSWAKETNHILELFNGPTFTFKDLGMQFLGGIMGYLLEQQKTKENINIIVATSGDTGSAAIHAVENHPLIDLYVLYPGNGRISNLQERQMATNTSSNVHCIRFDGSSDDADVVVSKLFQNEELVPFRLTTLNSVNIGRILMQSIHFIFGYVQTLAEKIIQSVKLKTALPSIRFCIPTGGLGNGSSCFLAKHMGIPIERIMMAVNENNTLSRALSTGIFQLKPVLVTNAPAMDICNPYNIERILYLASGKDSEFVKDFIAQHDAADGVKIRDDVFSVISSQFSSATANQEEVCEAIRFVYETWVKLLTHILQLAFLLPTVFV